MWSIGAVTVVIRLFHILGHLGILSVAALPPEHPWTTAFVDFVL